MVFEIIFGFERFQTNETLKFLLIFISILENFRKFKRLFAVDTCQMSLEFIFSLEGFQTNRTWQVHFNFTDILLINFNLLINFRNFKYFSTMNTWDMSVEITNRIRCSTCPLVFGCWELSHVIFLMLRKKELLAQSWANSQNDNCFHSKLS